MGLLRSRLGVGILWPLPTFHWPKQVTGPSGTSVGQGNNAPPRGTVEEGLFGEQSSDPWYLRQGQFSVCISYFKTKIVKRKQQVKSAVKTWSSNLTPPSPPVLHGQGMLLMEHLYAPGKKGRKAWASLAHNALPVCWAERETSACQPPASAMAAIGKPLLVQLEGSFPSVAQFLALALPLDRSLWESNYLIT